MVTWCMHRPGSGAVDIDTMLRFISPAAFDVGWSRNFIPSWAIRRPTTGRNSATDEGKEGRGSMARISRLSLLIGAV